MISCRCNVKIRTCLINWLKMLVIAMDCMFRICQPLRHNKLPTWIELTRSTKLESMAYLINTSSLKLIWMNKHVLMSSKLQTKIEHTLNSNKKWTVRTTFLLSSWETKSKVWTVKCKSCKVTELMSQKTKDSDMKLESTNLIPLLNSWMRLSSSWRPPLPSVTVKSSASVTSKNKGMELRLPRNRCSLKRKSYRITYRPHLHTFKISRTSSTTSSDRILSS